MNYKWIEAETYNEALRKIRKEYDSNVNILKTEEVYKGGFLGIGKKKYYRIQISIPDIVELSHYKKVLGIEDKFNQVKNKHQETTNDKDEIILQKIEELEKKIDMKLSSSTQITNLHPNLIEIKEILKENEFFDDFINEVIQEIEENLSVSKIDSRIELDRFIYEFLKKKLKVIGGIKIKNNNKKVVVFIGPTGVGKTTTVAKIAANAFKENVKVGLITIDGFRIGAKYQLEKYAEFMRLPIVDTEDPLELKRAIVESNEDLILVDTIGRSPNDDHGLLEMKQILNLSRYDAEFVLVVNASLKPRDVLKVFKKFELFDFENIIITKLDESDYIGGILNTAIKYDKGIRYYTTGQKVPTDIQKAEFNALFQKIQGLNLDIFFENIRY